MFLPIDDWNQLIKEYPGVDFPDETSERNFVTLEWQTEMGKKKLQTIAGNSTKLMEWEEAKKIFKP